MKKKVLEAVKRYSLIKNGDTVNVALSGGADSMALLNVLLELKDELGITVTASHFNHRIRGAEADRDEEFVRNACLRLGVELYISSADVPSYARKNGMGIELAARTLRYQFLESVSRGLIATAHTASDNVETVLFNLTRGTSSAGLCGIPKRRGNIIRPLILCSRNDVETYCRENNITFVTDSTNLCDDYSRNLIRHTVVPRLAEINPAIARSVGRMTDSIAENYDFLNSVTDGEYKKRYSPNGLSVAEFEKLHIAVAKGVILRFLKDSHIDEPDSGLIERVYGICTTGGKTNLPENRFAVSKEKILSVISKSDQSIPEYEVTVTEKEYCFEQKSPKIHNLFLKNTLDCDKIIGKSVLRKRNSGDSIKLYGRGCTKTLKKLFCEMKIPVCARDGIPVIADEEGVIWVYGAGVAQRCAVTENTTRILQIETTLKGEKQK